MASWAFSIAGGAESLFGHLARQSAALLKAEKGLIMLYDPQRREMEGQNVAFGFSPQQVARIRYAVDGEARDLWNFRLNGPLLTNNARTDPRLLPDLSAIMDVSSLVVVPMTRGPQVLGLIVVADRAGGAPFRDEDLATLQAVAGQATVAVENQRLHEQIKDANARLQEFDRIKSEFVATVAHDFRSPLMAIRGFAELTLEEPDLPPERRSEFMRTIMAETDDLARLANDTLLISHMETGQLHYDWKPLDVRRELKDAIPPGLDHPRHRGRRPRRLPGDQGRSPAAAPGAEQPGLQRPQVLALRGAPSPCAPGSVGATRSSSRSSTRAWASPPPRASARATPGAWSSSKALMADGPLAPPVGPAPAGGSPPPAFLVIGHVTRDVVAAAPGGFVYGGSVIFAAAHRRAPGPPGGDPHPLRPRARPRRARARACHLHRVPAEVTTTFENVYGPAGRVQYVRAVAPPIPAAGRSPALAAGPRGAPRAGGPGGAPGAGGGLPRGGAWWGPRSRAGCVPGPATAGCAPVSWPEAERVLSRVDVLIFSPEDVGGDRR